MALEDVVVEWRPGQSGIEADRQRGRDGMIGILAVARAALWELQCR
jgi:hypothetical protein